MSAVFVSTHFGRKYSCAVSGERKRPRSPAIETLTTRSAASLCQKSIVMATTIHANRPAQRAFTLEEWLNAKSKPGSKSFLKNICKSQNLFRSLPRQKFTCGTDAAESSRQFLHPNILENNTTAPCRVCGNAPGSYASNTLTTRSAVSLCQKLLVMTTLTIDRVSRRTLTAQGVDEQKE